MARWILFVGRVHSVLPNHGTYGSDTHRTVMRSCVGPQFWLAFVLLPDQMHDRRPPHRGGRGPVRLPSGADPQFAHAAIAQS
jgi:hypothetical protein